MQLYIYRCILFKINGKCKFINNIFFELPLKSLISSDIYSDIVIVSDSVIVIGIVNESIIVSGMFIVVVSASDWSSSVHFYQYPGQ